MKEYIIKNYVEGYNQFDLPKMVADFAEHVVFENIQNGEVNMRLQGLEAFVQQAEQAKAYFSERRQTIQSIAHTEHSTTVEIDYYAVLAMDFPNGLKKGQELRLSGKSIFEFEGNKIVKLTDLS